MEMRITKERCTGFLYNLWIKRTSYDPYLDCDNCMRRIKKEAANDNQD